jgi:hypothetical protein
VAKLNDLQLGTEKIGDVDFDAMPEQMGSFREDPQPGTYRFKLSAKLDDIWDTIDAKTKGTRINAIFDDTHPLVIVQSPGGALDGEPFLYRISNVERRRGKADDPNAVEVSDLDYLLRDGLGETTKPKTNAEYAKALMRHAGEEFTADLERSWNCRKDKNIRVFDETQQRTVEVEGTLGCGSRYYQKDVSKVPSDPNDPASLPVYPRTITCQCGAQIRGFSNLSRFRK